jgi:hypothetical protein
VVARAGTDSVKIAELMATLSYAADLGLGQPMAHCMRQTVVALRLANLAGASGRELEATYYLGLMMNVYCHADAAEQAQWLGDDIGMKSDTFDLLDMSTARMVAFMLRRAASHGSGLPSPPSSSDGRTSWRRTCSAVSWLPHFVAPRSLLGNVTEQPVLAHEAITPSSGVGT